MYVAAVSQPQYNDFPYTQSQQPFSNNHGPNGEEHSTAVYVLNVTNVMQAV